MIVEEKKVPMQRSYKDAVFRDIFQKDKKSLVDHLCRNGTEVETMIMEELSLSEFGEAMEESGREIGHEEAIAVASWLAEQERYDDLKKMKSDPGLRKTLFEEYYRSH